MTRIPHKDLVTLRHRHLLANRLPKDDEAIGLPPAESTQPPAAEQNAETARLDPRIPIPPSPANESTQSSTASSNASPERPQPPLLDLSSEQAQQMIDTVSRTLLYHAYGPPDTPHEPGALPPFAGATAAKNDIIAASLDQDADADSDYEPQLEPEESSLLKGGPVQQPAQLPIPLYSAVPLVLDNKLMQLQNGNKGLTIVDNLTRMPDFFNRKEGRCALTQFLEDANSTQESLTYFRQVATACVCVWDLGEFDRMRTLLQEHIVEVLKMCSFIGDYTALRREVVGETMVWEDWDGSVGRVLEELVETVSLPQSLRQVLAWLLIRNTAVPRHQDGPPLQLDLQDHYGLPRRLILQQNHCETL